MRSSSFQLFWLSAALAAVASANYVDHNSGDSRYIHSNDTIDLVLADGRRQELSGPPGTRVYEIQYELTNRESRSAFTVDFESDDGLVGVVDPVNVIVAQGEVKDVTLRILKVPNRPEGSKLEFQVTARRNSPYDGYPRSKRSAQQMDEEEREEMREEIMENMSEKADDGDGGERRLRPGLRPGGGNNNVFFPGNGGGAGGNGNYRPGGDDDDDWPDYADPSYRRQVQLVGLFTVTREGSGSSSSHVLDANSPDTSDDRVEGCSVAWDEQDCARDKWWVRFTVRDEGVGLNSIEVEPTDSVRPSGFSDANDRVVYYRYENFPLGTTEPVEVMAEASCCLEGITLRVTDLNLNLALEDADNFDDDDVNDEDDDNAAAGLGAGFVLPMATAVAAVYKSISYF